VKAVFLWAVPPPLRDVFSRGLPAWELVFPDSGFDAPALVEDAHAVVGWRITEAQLAAAPRLRLFQTPAAGPEWHVPLFRKFPHIPACNSHGNARTVAESAVALLLAQAKQIPFHDRAMRAGEWRLWKDDRPSRLLEGRRAGLVGLGAINRRVAEILRAFGMTVAAVKRDPSPEPGLAAVAGPDGLRALFSESDAILVAAPLTPETRGMIGADVLQGARPGAILVNVARGELVGEDALWEALTSGPLGGAALDVWYEYAPQPDAEGRKFPYRRPFHTLPNVTLSPHRAASPLDDAGRWEDIVENLRRVERGEPPLNRIDLDRGY
jgi:phosphoglycerate dehydrogenase-like enzyme